MTLCADKYRVREYVAEKAGPEILNEFYAVYERVDEINFDNLPDAFALKVNHHSGGNVFCRDKAQLNRSAARKKLKTFLDHDHYIGAREWAYKNIPRRIICEKYLEENGKPPIDYKFFCFHGEPLFIQVNMDRFEKHHRNCYDLQWNLQPFTLSHPNCEFIVEKPSRLDEMVKIAKKLSADFPFVRVDMYCIEGKVLFGEMTFYPGGGGECFSPESYDELWGAKLHLR